MHLLFQEHKEGNNEGVKAIEKGKTGGKAILKKILPKCKDIKGNSQN